MTQERPQGQFEKAKFTLSILTFVLPSICAVAIAYGTVKYTEGARAQEIIGIQNKVADLQKQIDTNRERLDFNKDRYVTREELRAYLDGIKTTLEDIQGDIRATRNR